MGTFPGCGSNLAALTLIFPFWFLNGTKALILAATSTGSPPRLRQPTRPFRTSSADSRSIPALSHSWRTEGERYGFTVETKCGVRTYGSSSDLE